MSQYNNPYLIAIEVFISTLVALYIISVSIGKCQTLFLCSIQNPSVWQKVWNFLNKITPTLNNSKANSILPFAGFLFSFEFWIIMKPFLPAFRINIDRLWCFHMVLFFCFRFWKSITLSVSQYFSAKRAITLLLLKPPSSDLFLGDIYDNNRIKVLEVSFNQIPCSVLEY